MDAERWRLVTDLFHRAVAVTGQARTALLAAACGNDEELRATVERLLAADASEHSVFRSPETHFFAAGDDQFLGQVVGAYRLTARLGEGGMGVVYRAQRSDGLFDRDVAVKLVRTDLPSEAVLRRFERERRTLAALVHPHIAAVYDGGTTERGTPFFVMELVDGQPLDQWCDARRATIAERLRLFALVCRAVHFAHQSLVVHGDLKPANILVDASGAPKLVDFGVARLLESQDGAAEPSGSGLTLARVLTPEYASPEQLAGGSLTTATDVYSLGVVLFQLLTGARPIQFESASLLEWERAVAARPPARPSEAVRGDEVPSRRRTTAARLTRALRGDLERIVLMALRKEPQRRYASAREFAADVERYLGGLPVVAREDSATYRAAKFVARHRAGVAGATLVALSLGAGTAAAVRGERQARAQAEHARTEADSARDLADFLIGDLQTSLPAQSADELGLAAARTLAEASRARARYTTDPHRLANALDGLGRVCMQLARPDEAEALFEEAYELRCAAFGQQSLETALSLGHLGELALRRGDAPHAAELLESALALHRADPGGAHADVARAANDLAVALRASGQLGRAEALHEEALALRRARPGATLLVAESLNNLGGVHLTRGALSAAIACLSEAHSIRREVLGDRHPLTLQAAANLANPTWATGDVARARELFLEAEAGYRELGEAGAEGLASTLSALASLDAFAGELWRARERLEESIALRRHRLGTTHPEVAGLLVKRAELEHAAGDDGAAEATWTEALSLLRSEGGSRGAALARHLRAHAVFQLDRGAAAEAERTLAEARALIDAEPGTDPADVGRVALLEGLAARAQGDLTRARSRFEAARDLLDAAEGAQPRERERVRRELASLP